MAESIFKRLPATHAAEASGWELVGENPGAGTTIRIVSFG